MNIGIDASNIRVGGGVTHLVQILSAADPYALGIKSITVWGGRKIMAFLPGRPWLRPLYQPVLDRPLPWRVWWAQVELPRQLRRERCDVLFAPAGIIPSVCPCPAVLMFQNLLPFEAKEARRYGLSWTRLRLAMIGYFQTLSLARARGAIFLTDYAREKITSAMQKKLNHVAIIPHGIEDQFRCSPRQQNNIDQYSVQRPYRLLYISIVDEYKHQSHVAEAVANLRRSGIPVTIDFVGTVYKPILRRFRRSLIKWDPQGVYLRYRGPTAYSDIPKVYHKASAFVFASSCENMPNILLEAMAAGLPIACSRRGPMPEILGDAGIYFDPEDPQQITVALKSLIENPQERHRLAWAAYERSKAYSWERCAQETLSFLIEAANEAEKSIPRQEPVSVRMAQRS